MSDNQVQPPKLTVEEDDVPPPHHPCKYKDIFPHVDQDVDRDTEHIWSLDTQELKLKAINDYIDIQLAAFNRWHTTMNVFNTELKDSLAKVMHNWATDVQDHLSETMDSLKELKQDTFLSGSDKLLKVKITWIKQLLTTEFHYGDVAYFT